VNSPLTRGRTLCRNFSCSDGVNPIITTTPYRNSVTTPLVPAVNASGVLDSTGSYSCPTVSIRSPMSSALAAAGLGTETSLDAASMHKHISKMIRFKWRGLSPVCRVASKLWTRRSRCGSYQFPILLAAREIAMTSSTNTIPPMPMQRALARAIAPVQNHSPRRNMRLYAAEP
jgi:hypothetical protein